MEKINVQGKDITIISHSAEDYISLTDIAKFRNNVTPADIVKNLMRSRSTVEFLGLWEKLHNPGFNMVEFDQFKNDAGANYFVLSPLKWIESTKAIGLISKSGKYGGGTYAHQDIAFEFASWISTEFKLYLIIEFQRLKEIEQKQLGWNIKRNLSKINYHIHTDAIKENLLPPSLTGEQINHIYASEADLLNMALFGKTAKNWRSQNLQKRGNICDEASVAQLICLSNLENLNALFIEQGLSQPERLAKLNAIAIHQMRLLSEDKGVKRLSDQIQ
ncbi:MAG TPA: DNA-binding protein [Anaerolineaceae bacterium]|nr:DNA-binding protein [Anaerolineaceae bacterium]